MMFEIRITNTACRNPVIISLCPRLSRAWPFLLLSVAIAFFVASLQAQQFSESWESGLPRGRLIGGSKSPDGKFVVFRIYRGDTTASAFALATADRQHLLLLLDVTASTGRADKPPNYLTLLWNTNSTFLALHDSLPKFSRLQVIRVRKDSATQVKLGEVIRSTALQRLRISESQISSAGEPPLRWLSENTLLVNARVKVAGTNAQTEVAISIREDDTAELCSEPGVGVVPSRANEVQR